MDREREKSRARKRRAHQFRKRTMAFRIMRQQWLWMVGSSLYQKLSREESERKCREQAARLADRMCSCSCSMCGNPRRHFKTRTRQEKKQRDFSESNLDEIGIHWSSVRSLSSFLRDLRTE